MNAYSFFYLFMQISEKTNPTHVPTNAQHEILQANGFTRTLILPASPQEILEKTISSFPSDLSILPTDHSAANLSFSKVHPHVESLLETLDNTATLVNREPLLEASLQLLENTTNHAANLLDPFLVLDLRVEKKEKFLLCDQECQVIAQDHLPSKEESERTWHHFSQAIKAAYGDELAKRVLMHEVGSPLTCQHVASIIHQCNASMTHIIDLIPNLLNTSFTDSHDHVDSDLERETQRKYETLSLEEQRSLKTLLDTGKKLLSTPGNLITAAVLLKGYGIGPAVTHAALYHGMALVGAGTLGAALVPVGALGVGIGAGILAGRTVGWITGYWDALIDKNLSSKSHTVAQISSDAAANISVNKTIGGMLADHVGDTVFGSMIDNTMSMAGLPGTHDMVKEVFSLAGYYAAQAAVHHRLHNLSSSVMTTAQSTHDLVGRVMSGSLASHSLENLHSENNEPSVTQPHSEITEEERAAIKANAGGEGRAFKVLYQLNESAYLPKHFNDYVHARYLSLKSLADIKYGTELNAPLQTGCTFKTGLRNTSAQLNFNNVLEDIKNHYLFLKQHLSSQSSTEPFVKERLDELQSIYTLMKQYEGEPHMHSRITRIACEAYNKILDAKEKRVDPTGSSKGLYVVNLYPYAHDIAYSVPNSP